MSEDFSEVGIKRTVGIEKLQWCMMCDFFLLYLIKVQIKLYHLLLLNTRLTILE